MSFLYHNSNSKHDFSARWMRVKLLQLATLMKPPITGGQWPPPFSEETLDLDSSWNDPFIFTGQGWCPSGKTPMTLHGLRSLSWNKLVFTTQYQFNCWPRLCWLWRCGGEEYCRGVNINPLILNSCTDILHAYILNPLPFCALKFQPEKIVLSGLENILCC